MQHPPAPSPEKVDGVALSDHARGMFETGDELDTLDELLERSFAGAGGHLTEIIAEERRLSARDLVRYLQGVRHFVVATVTKSGEPRCSAVDGLFLHGRLWFTSSGDSFKAKHLEKRSALSAAHVVGDDVGVFIHGHVRVVQGGPGEADAIRHYWTDIYESSPEDWVATPRDSRYFELIATSMYTYAFNRERFEAMVAEVERAVADKSQS
jgi:general stress protein 26